MLEKRLSETRREHRGAKGFTCLGFDGPAPSFLPLESWEAGGEVGHGSWEDLSGEESGEGVGLARSITPCSSSILQDSGTVAPLSAAAKHLALPELQCTCDAYLTQSGMT